MLPIPILSNNSVHKTIQPLYFCFKNSWMTIYCHSHHLSHYKQYNNIHIECALVINLQWLHFFLSKFSIFYADDVTFFCHHHHCRHHHAKRWVVAVARYIYVNNGCTMTWCEFEFLRLLGIYPCLLSISSPHPCSVILFWTVFFTSSRIFFGFSFSFYGLGSWAF